MNVICNTCAASHVFADNNIIFSNPFVWNTIIADDYLRLVQNYDKINFANLEVLPNTTNHRKDAQYRIVFDKQVSIYLPHHVNDSNYTTLTKKPNGRTMKIYYNNMKQYIFDTYSRRAGRMKDKPIFFVDYRSDGYQEWTDNDILKFIEIQTPYKKYICVNDKKWLKYDSPSCKILYKESQFKDTKESGKIFWENAQINVLIVSFNQPKLTEIAALSVIKSTPNAHIFILDNSTYAPFKAHVKNLTYLDNTKHKLIDFSKGFGGRHPSGGSAMHTLSIDKCFELIGDNFIHIDSDAIVKRDLNELVDESKIFVAELRENHPNFPLRVCPFAAFINVKMCKEHNVRFFNKSFMMGLTPNTKIFSTYDTGAFFFKEAKKYPYKEIKWNQYVEHLGRGSYAKDNSSIAQWINKFKKYWVQERKKNNTKVVYTCITGKYDSLIKPTYVDPDYDYICFTNNPQLKSDFWEIRNISHVISQYGDKKGSRYAKIKPHEFLKEYNFSVYIDANIDIKSSIDTFVKKNIENGKVVYIGHHPSRSCLYAEQEIVIRSKKDTKDNTQPQIDRYKEEGFPKNFGLTENNVILRFHNDEKCIAIMEDWWGEVERGSHRDQLSLMYCLWKHNSEGFKYLSEIPRKSSNFKFFGHGVRSANNSFSSVAPSPKPVRVYNQVQSLNTPSRAIHKVKIKNSTHIHPLY